MSNFWGAVQTRLSCRPLKRRWLIFSVLTPQTRQSYERCYFFVIISMILTINDNNANSTMANVPINVITS